MFLLCIFLYSEFISNPRYVFINIRFDAIFLPEMLVSSASADLTLQDNSKNTALHLACSKVGTHFKDMFSLLISTMAFKIFPFH